MGSVAALDFKSCYDWCLFVARPSECVACRSFQRIATRSSTVRFFDNPQKVPYLFSYFPVGAGDV